MKRLLTTLPTCMMMVFGLVACGGGGGSAGSASAPAPVATSTPAPAPVINTTADLSASKDMLFTSSERLSLDIDLEDFRNADMFLNLCSDFSAQPPHNVNYASCMVRTRLKGGNYQGDISVPNHIETLIVEIRFLDGVEDTIYQMFATQELGGTLSLR